MPKEPLNSHPPTTMTSTPKHNEFTADNATTDKFCAVVGPALLSAAESAAVSAGKAIAQALQSLLTVKNITKCLNCTGSKLDDDLGGGGHKQPNCGDKDGSTTPAQPPNKGVSHDKDGKPVPIQTPDKPVTYIDYPRRFDESIHGPESVNHFNATPTRWQNMGQTSLNWRLSSSRKSAVH